MAIKIVTSAATALLIITLGIGGEFYVKMYKPLKEENARMHAGLPGYEKAAAELTKLREKERAESGWVKPMAEILGIGLGKEIKSGQAEVLASGNKIIVNISEQLLFLPGSYTFAKESPQLRAVLVSLLKNDALKGKDLYIGNTSKAVPAQGKGRKKIPSKEARTLAAERSAALIRDFEKNGVNQDALIAVAYSTRHPLIGSMSMDYKTSIIIENPPPVLQNAAINEAAKPASMQPAPDAKSEISATVAVDLPALHAPRKPIPIIPAKPKAQ